MGQFGTILGPFETIWDQLGQFRNILDHLKPFGTIGDHLGQFWDLLDQLGPFGTNWDFFGTFWAEMEGTNLDHLGLIGII